MPELPEVETTRRGIAPYMEQQTIADVIARCDQLRKPIQKEALSQLAGRTIQEIQRWGKHLIVVTDHRQQALHLHLGMSGTLRICRADEPYKKHDQICIVLNNQTQIRLHDPRKFGDCAVIDLDDLPKNLAQLGVEPLTEDFNDAFLLAATRGRRMAIKTFIMDQKYILGVGNIYATEALFFSGIHPLRPAGQLTAAECQLLVKNIKEILKRAIAQGGTTLRDFASPDGSHGYFVQTLAIYGKYGLPCPKCGCHIAKLLVNNRTTTYCPQCQL